MLTQNLSVGILAHVDAGKTTLSEGIMFKSGQIRSLGRVDHRDAFLDTDVQERERKITIFSKQAIFHWKNRKITLMDTPGHVDFSAETERVLPVLDAAVLVISGADGVQGHTVTLWRLLKKYGVPVFVFVNKMDQPGTDRQRILEELKRYLGDGFIDTAQADEQEEIALHDEEALNEYLSNGCVSLPVIQRLVSGRKVFPVYFGAALKLLGIEQLLDGICDYMPPISYPDIFSARVFKIGRDPQGARLTYAKITGGSVKVRALLSGAMREREEGGQWQEKISQIRM